MHELFEKETGISESYDPYGDAESGCYSSAYKDEYIKWLTKKVKQLEKENSDLLNSLTEIGMEEGLI